MGFIVRGVDVGSPDGVLVEQGPQFRVPMMRKTPTALVIHESVTRSAATSYKVLVKRGLSVQACTHPDSAIVQHADLHSICEHAGAGRNPIAIGNEVTNPYYPTLLRKGLPWTKVIEDAPWAHRGAYVVPTALQAEACAQWTAFCTAPGSPVGVPREWPGLVGGTMNLGRVKGPLRRGILAHAYFGHADGTWLVLYAWLRLVVGMHPSMAYAEAIRRATGVRDADVSDITPR